MRLTFLCVIMGATDPQVPIGFAPILLGLVLTLGHPISVPITNLRIIPRVARDALSMLSGWAPGQLWLFWVAPIVGGILGASALSRYRTETGQP